MHDIAKDLEIATRNHRTGNILEAETQYRRILQEEPNQPDALNGLGIVAFQLNKHNKAIDFIEKAIRNKPSEPQFHYNSGLILVALKKHAEAVEAFKQAINIKPDYADAYYNLALTLKRLEQYEEAIENFDQSIRFSLDNADANYNMGNIYKIMDQNDSAIEHYQLAIKQNPYFDKAYNNMGSALKDRGLIEPAINHYRKAIQLNSAFEEAHWNLSLALLLNGEFEEGWKEHEWRFRRQKSVTVYPYRFVIPLWDGSSFYGKKIFVHSEQGLGDTLQFIRYLPILKSLGGTVTFETFGQLLKLLKDFPGIDELVEISSERNYTKYFDYYVPLMSLPNIFGTTINTIPNKTPYLTADKNLINFWTRKLYQFPSFKIGICWQGKPTYEDDSIRSIPLEYFYDLTRIENVQIISLQKNHGIEQLAQVPKDIPILNLDPELDENNGSFMDTAAIMKSLDLVITSDTAIAHLAGALGIPVWVLLSFVPDWRWLLNRTDSPWYPTMRLFRQTTPGDWNSVFKQVTDALTILLQGKNKEKRIYH